jgi:hypothetical protein
VVGLLRDESVDLIYLDPPFNSKASYNVLFKAPTGEHSQAQIEAFEDTVRLAMPEIGLFDAIYSVARLPRTESCQSSSRRPPAPRRLRDPPTEWSRQFEALGLNPE